MRKIMTPRWGRTMFVILLLTVAPAQAQQTRANGPDGRSLGTASPYGNGSTRYYDSRGNVMGTSTVTSTGTTYYDARGNVTGRATATGGRQ